MKTFKKYGKTMGIFLVVVFLLLVILTFLNIGNILYTKSTDTIILVGMILFFAIIGFEYGKKAQAKGYLEGLKIGASLILLLIVINLLFYQTGFSIARFIYYLVLILSSTLGSMIGINRKR